MLKKNLLYRLPIELMREHIIPFTYNPQPDFLLKDIRNFTSFRCEIFDLYKTLYPNYENLREIMEWVSNDISRFNNQDIPLMYVIIRKLSPELDGYLWDLIELLSLNA